MRKGLYVDLDGTLIKTDLLLESFFSYFSKSISAPIVTIYILLTRGRLGLKKYLFEKSAVEVKTLPYRNEVLEYVEKWRSENDGQVVLISAADGRYVQAVSDFLGIFDHAEGSADYNLKGIKKLSRIRELTAGSDFTYMGDSKDDLPIWKAAERAVLVNPASSTLKFARTNLDHAEIIADKSDQVLVFFRAIRVHQWVKNSLIGLPLLLSQNINLSSLAEMLLGIFAFSMVASSFYILNDLFDVRSDRVHKSKCHRPLASGDLSFAMGGLYFIFMLFISSFVSLVFLPLEFIYCLITYAVATFSYSKFFKKVAVVDILSLTFLYVFRVFSGAVLFEIEISNWLLSFSVFLFLFLATIKRFIEISGSNTTNIAGRGYVTSDKDYLRSVSNFSGLISVLILCLYLDSNQAQHTFSVSQAFWIAPALLLYWVLDLLFKVERGVVDDDPVKHVLKSLNSYFIFGILIVFFFFS